MVNQIWRLTRLLALFGEGYQSFMDICHVLIYITIANYLQVLLRFYFSCCLFVCRLKIKLFLEHKLHLFYTSLYYYCCSMLFIWINKIQLNLNGCSLQVGWMDLVLPPVF